MSAAVGMQFRQIKINHTKIPLRLFISLMELFEAN